jgi:hypothetical protein
MDISHTRQVMHMSDIQEKQRRTIYTQNVCNERRMGVKGYRCMHSQAAWKLVRIDSVT